MSKKGQTRKHIPYRTCVACQRKTEKRRLTRLVCTRKEGVVVDPSGKRNGRGAYLCDDPFCWDRALTGNFLDQALRTGITATEKARLAQYKPAKVAG